MADLFTQIMKGKYADQLALILEQDSIDIDKDFLGFTNTYKHLSRVIPKDYVVIDLGCAYAIQAFYFRKHKKYIGVDLVESQYFTTDNSEIYTEGIPAFLNKYSHQEDGREFAICNYVPNWHSQNMELVKQHFQNCFTFYPCIIS